MFSIIIPSWNNLAFLKSCIQSIKKNSSFEHQIILHLNDGSDGSCNWATKEGIQFTQSITNIGICEAVNKAAALANKDYIVYMNDDMYALPGWDLELMNEINEISHNCFLLSSTMIEPKDSHNACVIVKNFGDSLETFDEASLLKEYKNIPKDNWSGSAWPPTIVHKSFWNLVGGYSIEFSPGMSSDDDFAMKMWQVGCRIFKGIGKSRVYHFQAKSTQRITKNNGRKQFLMKWGINQSTFNKYYIKRGESINGLLVEPSVSRLKFEKIRAWIKRKIM